MDSCREGWKDWVTFNATDLTWIALVIGGVLHHFVDERVEPISDDRRFQ
jgi:hypothetical protein